MNLPEQAVLFGPPERIEIRGGFVVREIQRGTASAFVENTHRHLDAPPGDLFRIGAFDEQGMLRGVAIVGRPVSRKLDDSKSVEITRLATDGSRNLCSILYGASCRIAFRRGWKRVYTYTRIDEPGTSLRASSFAEDARTRGRQWDCPSRPRKDREIVDRIRWVRSKP